MERRLRCLGPRRHRRREVRRRGLQHHGRLRARRVLQRDRALRHALPVGHRPMGHRRDGVGAVVATGEVHLHLGRGAVDGEVVDLVDDLAGLRQGRGWRPSGERRPAFQQQRARGAPDLRRQLQRGAQAQHHGAQGDEQGRPLRPHLRARRGRDRLLRVPALAPCLHPQWPPVPHRIQRAPRPLRLRAARGRRGAERRRRLVDGAERLGPRPGSSAHCGRRHRGFGLRKRRRSLRGELRRLDVGRQGRQVDGARRKKRVCGLGVSLGLLRMRPGLLAEGSAWHAESARCMPGS
mmetsp:Transcript_92955/g.259775  ORF Transcript_92955/g.259775 Transcript_92955/m.259775 type:complete len:293 (+) Transcript_92955:1426-2304(+)